MLLVGTVAETFLKQENSIGRINSHIELLESGSKIMEKNKGKLSDSSK